MESPRQKKIAALLQQEIAQLLQGAIRKEGVNNLLVSVTKVSVTVDLSVAKIYLSLFPSKEAGKWLEGIQSNAFQVKHDLAQLLRNELRRIPELQFFLDDSLDYIEGIDAALKATENPILEREKLAKRKKK
ncbi:30S ribosome-binding factor RbfA [Flavobacteriaceae bacterium]|jgi:ribosome-binding factor A|nr:30S ribosome-binding factor RbfA [Flavobacteriaceae bacterium]